MFLGERNDLDGKGKTAGVVFGIELFAIQRYIKHTAGTLDQVDRALGKLFLQVVRQTGGTREVVSNHTVFDVEGHYPPS